MTTIGAVEARRPVGQMVAVLGILAVALALLASVPAQAQEDRVIPARVGGQTRLHTAANIAALTFNQADVAHLVFAGNFPDALAASYAAGVADGPILLSPTEKVGPHSPTMQALEQLGVQEVRLIGGPAVLSRAVEQELAAHGYRTRRIAGEDRYGTAAEVATFYGVANNVGTVDGQRTAIMASGANFPDALAAGPVAAAANLPLLLSPPHRPHAATDDALQRLDIDRILLIGGPAAVSAAVEQHYRQQGYVVERIAGTDRVATAALVADAAVRRFGFSHDLVLLARGDDFPDAVAASVHGARAGAPIVLARTPTFLSQRTRNWFAANCPRVDVVRALGGSGAVADATLATAVDAAEVCLDEPPGPVGEPSMEERRGEGFPAGDYSDVVDVRPAAHDGFDRVVLEFAGPQRPGWGIRWVDEPRYQPSGHPADIEGEAFLVIDVQARDEWLGQNTYPGPDRIRVDGNVITEIVKTSEFEAHTEWTVGLKRKEPFAAVMIDDPTRLIVDVVQQ